MRSRRTHKYGTSQYSADGVLSLIMGILAWALFFVVVMQSLITAGTASALYGYIFIVSVVFALWGVVFSFIAWRAEEGNLAVKRFIILFNLVLLVLEAALIILNFK